MSLHFKVNVGKISYNLTQRHDMEDQMYSTGTLTTREIISFKIFLDKEIGTEYQVDTIDKWGEGENGVYLGEAEGLTIFDLNDEEVTAIREFEKRLMGEA